MTYCTRCECWFEQPGTCNCYAGIYQGIEEARQGKGVEIGPDELVEKSFFVAPPIDVPFTVTTTHGMGPRFVSNGNTTDVVQ